MLLLYVQLSSSDERETHSHAFHGHAHLRLGFHLSFPTIFESIAPSCLRALAFVFPMRTVRTTTTPPLPCLPGSFFLSRTVPPCTLCTLCRGVLSLSPLPSLVLNSRSFLHSPHACVWLWIWSLCLEVLLQDLIGSLLMFRWDDRSLLAGFVCVAAARRWGGALS
jgi:hypothetical protein